MCDLDTHTGPQAQKGPTLDLMLWCHHLEILNNLWTGALHFNLALPFQDWEFCLGMMFPFMPLGVYSFPQSLSCTWFLRNLCKVQFWCRHSSTEQPPMFLYYSFCSKHLSFQSLQSPHYVFSGLLHIHPLLWPPNCTQASWACVGPPLGPWCTASFQCLQAGENAHAPGEEFFLSASMPAPQGQRFGLFCSLLCSQHPGQGSGT